MNLQLPEGLPAWLGWVLFASTLILLITREIVRVRSDASTRKKTEAETLRIKLDLLRDQAESYQAQLAAISEALAADPAIRPTETQIDALAARDETEGIARHLRARARARGELPVVVARLASVQSRQVELERDISLGVAVQTEHFQSLRTSMDDVSSEVATLVREIADSPRIYVGGTPPEDAVDGDIFFAIPEEDS